MKLSKLLDESLGTGAIAMGPMTVLGGKPKNEDEKEVHRSDTPDRWYIPGKNTIRQKKSLSEQLEEEKEESSSKKFGTEPGKHASRVWPKEESAQGNQPTRWYHTYATDVKRNRYGTKNGFS